MFFVCRERFQTLPLSFRAEKDSFLPFIFFTFIVTSSAIASDNNDDQYSFDSSLSISHYKSLDLNKINKESYLSPGRYALDLYVNDKFITQENFIVKNDDKSNAIICLDKHITPLLDIKPELSNKINEQESKRCLQIKDIVPDASYKINGANQHIEFSIPQIYLNQRFKGEVAPSQWRKGIIAGQLSYNLNTTNELGKNRSSTLYLDSSLGFNLSSWKFNQDISVEKESSRQSQISHTNTYVQTSLPAMLAKLTIGDITSSDTVLDSARLRGIQLTSDENMLPAILRNYSPQIRGLAKTNALIEVRQYGQIIYRTTVAPGPFLLNDLPAASGNGNLDITINETDGTRRHIVMPAAVSNNLLRPGQKRYSVALGKLVNSLPESFSLLQGSFLYGLSNFFTLHAGAMLASRYSAETVGSSLLTSFGVLSLDAIRSHYAYKNNVNDGKSLKFSWLMQIAQTQTSLALSMQKNSSGYLGIASLADNQENSGYTSHQKYQYQAIINQPIGDSLGNFYLSGIASKNYGHDKIDLQYQAGYGFTYKNITFDLSLSRDFTHNTERGDSGEKIENRINFGVEIPLSDTHHLALSSSVDYDRKYNQSVTRINGSAGDDNNLSAQATMTQIPQGDNTINMWGQYISPYSTLSGSYTYQRQKQQVALSAAGGALLHRGGLTLTPYHLGSTSLLVEAPGASGATVAGQSTIELDHSGYALIPSASPWTNNEVTLNASHLSNTAEIKNNVASVAPYDDSVVKVHFDTIGGFPAFIAAKDQKNQPLPLGSEVFNENNQSVGFVAQGSTIYVRLENVKGRLKVVSGDTPDDMCFINYDASQTEKKDDIFYLKGVCHA